MTQLSKGLPPKAPSPLQWLALQLFRRMRDDVRGVIALLLVALSVYLAATGRTMLCELVLALAVGLFIVNFRHSRQHRPLPTRKG